jgi:hypothetical protein
METFKCAEHERHGSTSKKASYKRAIKSFKSNAKKVSFEF